MKGDAPEMIGKLLEGLSSSFLTYVCPDKCQDMKAVQRTIIFLGLKSDDLTDLSHDINESVSGTHKKCRACQKEYVKTHVFGDLVILETARSGSHNVFTTVTLQAIPQQLNLGSNFYSLKFLIDYDPPVGHAIGHYTCYCMKDNRFVFINDMLRHKTEHVDACKKVNPSLIVYWKTK